MPKIPFFISALLMAIAIIQNILLVYFAAKNKQYKNQLDRYIQNNLLNSTTKATSSPTDDTITNTQSNGGDK